MKITILEFADGFYVEIIDNENKKTDLKYTGKSEKVSSEIGTTITQLLNQSRKERIRKMDSGE